MKHLILTITILTALTTSPVWAKNDVEKPLLNNVETMIEATQSQMMKSLESSITQPSHIKLNYNNLVDTKLLTRKVKITAPRIESDSE